MLGEFDDSGSIGSIWRPNRSNIQPMTFQSDQTQRQQQMSQSLRTRHTRNGPDDPTDCN
jgi:hypothetical protein